MEKSFKLPLCAGMVYPRGTSVGTPVLRKARFRR